MTRSISNAGLRWLSFHVFVGENVEPFLVAHFRPALEAALASGQIKRFFFIRYSEGGMHLRLRFLPAQGIAGETVACWMRSLVEEFSRIGDPACHYRLEQHSYNRADLYFRNTKASVYAELLNEQTSYFALQLLSATLATRSQILISFSGAIEFILRNSANSKHEYLALLYESRKFAAAAIQGLKMSLPASSDNTQRVEILRCVIPSQSRSLKENSSIRRVIKLIQRLRRTEGLYSQVGTHALHLLCNKVGLSLIDEYCLFSGLLKLGTRDPRQSETELIYDRAR
jgi:thiopeptide-type bacteriocin biosynthesis protein